MPSRLLTSDLARAAGCHVNTVRLYEKLGFLPPVPRSAKGYRLYSLRHLDLMVQARKILGAPWAGRAVRRVSIAMLKASAAGDRLRSLEYARRYGELVRSERVRAAEAVAVLEKWASRKPARGGGPGLRIGPAAARLGVTRDALRTWERNGLVRAPRESGNRYREYGPIEMDRLAVIRMLRQAGFSLMAILRMIGEFEKGRTRGLGKILDRPRPDEDVYSAADRWVSSLRAQQKCARDSIRKYGRD